MTKKIGKVILLVGGFPTKENPARCIFNYRAAQLISAQGINLEVIFIRALVPGRPIISTVKEKGFNVTTLCIPMIPGYSEACLKAYLELYPYFIGRLVKNASIIHSVGADTIGFFGSMISKKFKLKHITQLIGSDVNSILPLTKNKWPVKGWESYIDGVSANSVAILNQFLKLYPNNTSNTIVNYRGVDLDYFKPSSRNAELTFLYLGGLPNHSESYGINLKGGETLMRVWGSLDKKLETVRNVKLLFGGPGSDKDIVIQWKESLNFPENVEILGNLPPQKIKEYMSATKLVIIPSKKEGAPNVAFESMASGLPILASNVGGLPELIQNNINGWLLDPENENLWIEKMKIIISNPTILEKMGQASREIAEEKFSNQAFANRIIQLYDQVLFS